MGDPERETLILGAPRSILATNPATKSITAAPQTRMASFVTHLESTADGSRLGADAVVTTHKHRPVLVRYDPSTVGDALALDVLRASQGTAVSVSEARILEWMQLAASTEGLSVGPESAVCVGAAEMLAASGWIRRGERVVLFNCGASQKYAHLSAGVRTSVNGAAA